MSVERDADLLAQAKAGRSAAFEALFMPYAPMLFAYGRAVCGDHHAAQDVVQETALVAYRNLNMFFPDADFATWLRAIARRRALEARRRLNRVGLIDDNALELAFREPEPVSSVRRDALRQCLRALGGRMGLLVDGRYFKGTPISEMATALGMSANAARQILFRARLALEDCVRNRLGVENP